MQVPLAYWAVVCSDCGRRPMQSKQYGGAGCLKPEPTWGCARPKIKLIIPKLFYSLSAHSWDCCQKIFDVWVKKTALVNSRLNMGVFPLGLHSKSCTQTCHTWSPCLNGSLKGYNVSVCLLPWHHCEVSFSALSLSMWLFNCPCAFLVPQNHRWKLQKWWISKCHEFSLSWCRP